MIPERRIAIFGQADNMHTHRWARWLADRGEVVALLSDTPPRPTMNYERVQIIGPNWSLWQKFYAFKLHGGTYANNWHKWMAYRGAIVAFQPTILVAMEARSYGPMLKHFPQYIRILMPWGTDMRCLDPDDAMSERKEEARLVRQSVESADLITTNGRNKKDLWMQITGLGPEFFELSEWGIDTSIFRLDREKPIIQGVELLGLQGLPRILLSPRLAQKNYHIDDIMRAWSDMKSQRHGEFLVVLRAGANDQSWSEINALQSSLRDESIRLVNRYFTPIEMAAIYNASCGCIMYPDDDLAALTLLEAAACGVIPVVKNLPSYRFLFQSQDKPLGFTSELIDAHAALHEMIGKWLQAPRELLEGGRIENAQIMKHKYEWNNRARQIARSAFIKARKNFLARTGYIPRGRR